MPNSIQTPTYHLRSEAVLRALRPMQPGDLLEIGCGRGEFLTRLASRGWRCTALELSPSAATEARAALAEAEASVQVAERYEEIEGQFDVVLAMEVLEHIEDDFLAALRWTEWLRTGGSLILTVPAHMRYWTRADVYGGHVRRYDRQRLTDVARRAGLTVDHILSFGYPLPGLLMPIRNWWYKRRLTSVKDLSKQQRTLQSSFDSVREVPVPLAAAGLQMMMAAIFRLQIPLMGTDLGPSFLFVGRKEQATRHEPE